MSAFLRHFVSVFMIVCVRECVCICEGVSMCVYVIVRVCVCA